MVIKLKEILELQCFSRSTGEPMATEAGNVDLVRTRSTCFTIKHWTTNTNITVILSQPVYHLSLQVHHFYTTASLQRMAHKNLWRAVLLKRLNHIPSLTRKPSLQGFKSQTLTLRKRERFRRFGCNPPPFGNRKREEAFWETGWGEKIRLWL